MRSEEKKPRDAATFGDARHPPAQDVQARRARESKIRTETGERDRSEGMDAEILENVPGERHDLNPENRPGNTGTTAGGFGPHGEPTPQRREIGDMSPDDFDDVDT